MSRLDVFLILILCYYYSLDCFLCSLIVCMGKNQAYLNAFLSYGLLSWQVPLFCLCMGGIMYYLEHEPDTMAPFLRGLIRRFLASRISNPSPSFNSNSSYTYLQSLDAIDKPNLEATQEKTAASSEKYNIESFPGL